MTLIPRRKTMAGAPSDKKKLAGRFMHQRKMRWRNPSSGFYRALTCGAALLLCAAAAQAEGTPIPHGTLELIAQNQWIAAGHTLDLGLHFQLEKGWHIYWVNPGDSGEPPRVKWQLPTGLNRWGNASGLRRGVLQRPASWTMVTRTQCC